MQNAEGGRAAEPPALRPTMARPYRFCPCCGTALQNRRMHSRDRLVCPGCAFVFWQNPVVGVAVILLEQGRILLARRARGPYQGHWCIPCGYVEYDEEVRQAAQREFQEETGLLVQVGAVYAVHSNFHNPASHSVGIWFCGTLLGGTLRAADDVDQVAYFALHSLPQALAFPTDRLVLAQLQRDAIA
ncbi:MAG: NUDIX domain-containing protein [Candidatus Tectimicrobiota bacterium]